MGDGSAQGAIFLLGENYFVYKMAVEKSYRNTKFWTTYRDIILWFGILSLLVYFMS